MVLRRAAWVTACSDDLRQRALALGANTDRTETVPYGVDATRFAPSPGTRAEVRRELAIGDAPLVVAAGRLVGKKGFEFLIDAARMLVADHPALRVIIAGDGDLRADLAARSAALGGRVVTLAGTRSQDDIARLVAAADVVAVPSVHDQAGNVDGLPNFALEAMASAAPVVATTAGGLPQVIEDGVTGRLVPERDATALAAAIGDLLRHAERRRALGDAARRHVERHFGWARVAARLEAIYDRSRR
jgi:colanic acid/amylovoran biosynthesis glycosyltransferase